MKTLRKPIALIVALVVLLSALPVISGAQTTVSLSSTAATMGVGEKLRFVATTNSSNPVTWASRDTSVATVSKTGVVTALEIGETTIRASVDGVNAFLTLTVKKAPTTVKLNDLEVKVGQTKKLTVLLTKDSASRTRKFESSDTSVATVDKHGNVKGIKEGAAEITVTTYNGLSSTATVTVTEPPAVGKIIKFGGYDWQVLDVTDGRMLVISDKVFEPKRYHNTHNAAATWEVSAVRAHLNDQLYNSFSPEDKAKIIQVTNTNPDNQWYGTAGGEDTKDYIFLLSLDEVVKYFGDSGQLANRPSENAFWINDQYNQNRKAYDADGNAGWWWLRSPGGQKGRAASVDRHGRIGLHGDGVANIHGGYVRPAMWLAI